MTALTPEDRACPKCGGAGWIRSTPDIAVPAYARTADDWMAHREWLVSSPRKDCPACVSITQSQEKAA